MLREWQIWARPSQRPPLGNWLVWLLKTGRGWGKTRTGAEFVIDRVRKGYQRIALVGQTKRDVRDTMVEIGDSSILQCCPPDLYPEYEPSKSRITWPQTGAVAMFYSGDEPDQLRGPQHDTAWVDELAKFKYPKLTWDNLELGMRLSADPRVCVTTTPRPIPIMKELIAEGAIVVDGSTYDNEKNLPPAYLARIKKKYEGTRLGRQELHGEMLKETPGALWTLPGIELDRVKECPPLVRVVVGVDPGASNTEGSASTGIVAGGLGTDGHGYLLGDFTLQATPAIWGSQVVKVFNVFQGDRVVAERNNGGDMVELTIRTADPNVPYKSVWASHGKRTRAEPVSALYEQHRIHHVGMFPDLEDQMTTWVPGTGADSPDNMDAMVWVFTELFLSEPEAETETVFVDGAEEPEHQISSI